MRGVIQRVSECAVSVDGEIVGQIGPGLLILLGVEADDTSEDIDYLVKKIIGLRIFNDADGKMNLSVSDIGGELLVVSQFTLYADTRKGNRPSFIRSAPPQFASDMIDQLLDRLGALTQKPIHTGVFGADMKVSLLNDGPVTIIIDSKNKSF